MQDTFKEYKVALDSYEKDIDELKGMSGRLMGWLNELKDGKRKPDASAFKAELKTINAQMDKIVESANDAQKRYFAKVDGLNERIVTKFRGLCALAAGTGKETAGTRLLLDECKDFESAKGDIKMRKGLYDSVCMVAEAVAGASETKTERNIPREKLAIFEQFMNMPDGEGKGAFYAEHKAVILAVEDLRKLN